MIRYEEAQKMLEAVSSQSRYIYTIVKATLTCEHDLENTDLWKNTAIQLQNNAQDIINTLKALEEKLDLDSEVLKE